VARGRVMYAFLVALGAVITAAGLALLASGVSVQDHGLDAAIVTQGVIAIIGGCILIGLAFVVRALLRVERALMLRPMARTAGSGESVESAAAAAAPGETARIPFPPNPRKAAAQNRPATIAVEARAVPPAQQTPAEPNSVPALTQLENAPVVEESNVSLLPAAPARSDAGSEETHLGTAGKLNGAAHAKAVPPRPAESGRPPRRAQQGKVSIFDSLWPKAQRSASDVQPPPAQPAPASAAPAQTEDEAALAPVGQSSAAAEPPASMVQIVKSGVVEGMAYTLYSDGSIEAQLPGGTIHFRSITELRNHIEKNG